MLTSKLKQISMLSIPLIGGMISQNILNLVDTIMIGQLGHLALAGAGIGSFLFFMSFAGFGGIASAVQTMVARYYGNHQLSMISVPLVLGTIVSLGIAIVFTGIEYGFSEWLVRFFSEDQDVFLIANQYFSYRILGLPFLSFCLVVRGFWSGMSKPMRYLGVIIVIHTLNIVLNYLLIFGHLGFPSLGAAGAGLASTLSLIIGTCLYWYDCRQFMVLKSILLLSKARLLRTIKWMIVLAFPTAIQQFLFAFGIAVFFWILGQLGAEEMAIGNVLVNIVLIGILPGMGFAMATLTLVSQSIGEQKIPDAYKWPFYACQVAAVVVGVIVLAGIIFPSTVLSWFIKDPLIIAKAIRPLQLDCIGVIFEVGALIFMHALNGADKTRLVLVISIVCQWLFFIPLAYCVGLVWMLGLTAIWVVWPVYQCLQMSVFIGIWVKSYSNVTSLR